MFQRFPFSAIVEILVLVGSVGRGAFAARMRHFVLFHVMCTQQAVLVAVTGSKCSETLCWRCGSQESACNEQVLSRIRAMDAIAVSGLVAVLPLSPFTHTQAHPPPPHTPFP